MKSVESTAQPLQPHRRAETSRRNAGFLLAAFCAIPVMALLAAGLDGAVTRVEQITGSPVPPWLRDALVLSCYGWALLLTCGGAVRLFNKRYPGSAPRRVLPPETAHHRGGMGA